LAVGNGVQLVLSKNGYIALLTDDALTMTIVSFDPRNQGDEEEYIF